MTTEIPKTPTLTPSLIAAALAELARVVTARRESASYRADSDALDIAANEVAPAFATTPGLARLAVAYVEKGQPALNALVVLGMAERNATLLALGRRYATRLSNPASEAPHV